jgi:hypothetical protein
VGGRGVEGDRLAHVTARGDGIVAFVALAQVFE